MSSQLQKKLAALRESFRASLPERLEEGFRIVARLRRDCGAEAKDTRRLHRLLHELTGSSGFIGDVEIAGHLKEALAICEAVEDEGRTPAAGEIGRIERTLEETARLCKSRAHPA